jgi:hypothetical protein
MTLVVARCENGRIAIAADTLVSEHDASLEITKGVVKSCCLPRYICVSFSGSPELAHKAFTEFRETHPKGADFETTVKFFETSSSQFWLAGFGDLRMKLQRAKQALDAIALQQISGGKRRNGSIPSVLPYYPKRPLFLQIRNLRADLQSSAFCQAVRYHEW